MTFLLNRTLDQVRKSRDTEQPNERNTTTTTTTTTTKLNKTNETWKHDLFEDTTNNDNKKKLNRTTRRTSESVNGDEGQEENGRSTSLLITNLHYDVSEAELEALFSQIGKIDRGPFIKFDQSGRASEGLAFVSYANESHAEAAMEAFNGASAKGQPIGVSYAFTMPGWVRGTLGIGRRDSATGVPTFGLLGRIQQERPATRHQYSPYDSSRPRGPRSSFPPGKPHRSSYERDHRRTTDSFGSGIRSRGGPGHRGVARPRTLGERSSTHRPSTTVKSARDLDKELEAFMGSTPVPGRANNSSTGAQTDVQMAE